jgi:hypothetical protein
MTTMPDEVLLRILGHVMVGDEQHAWEGGPEGVDTGRNDRLKKWRSAVRAVCGRWRALHDSACEWMAVGASLAGLMAGFGMRTPIQSSQAPYDEGMRTLCGRLPALTHLVMQQMNGGFGPFGVTCLSEEGLRAVGGLTSLQYLDLCNCANVTDGVLRELRGLTGLTLLSLGYCTRMTAAGMRELRTLTNLTFLDLDSCTNLTDVMLQELRSLPKLTVLSLPVCEDVTDDGMRELSSLPTLTTLNLYKCAKVTNMGLRELSGLTALSTLNVAQCTNLTDVGLQPLTSLKALTSLLLNGTNTTMAGRNALKKALPALTINTTSWD